MIRPPPLLAIALLSIKLAGRYVYTLGLFADFGISTSENTHSTHLGDKSQPTPQGADLNALRCSQKGQVPLSA